MDIGTLLSSPSIRTMAPEDVFHLLKQAQALGRLEPAGIRSSDRPLPARARTTGAVAAIDFARRRGRAV